MLNREGTLLVADTGSTNGTFINGRRIGYGEARQIEEGDVVGFGDIEVRFRKVD
jgi:pSer/pThr/pTyr-binding forkhead associated (FHA) protein